MPPGKRRSSSRRERRSPHSRSVARPRLETANVSARRTGSLTVKSSTYPKAMARLLSIALILILAGSGVGRTDRLSAQSPKKIRVAFLYSDGNLPSTLKAYKALLNERPELKDQVTFTFLTESMFDDVKVMDMAAADVLVFDTMNEQ